MGRPDPKELDRAIAIMEGALQALREQDPAYRPRSLACNLLSQRLGCSANKVKQLYALHRRRRKKDDRSAMFVDLYEQIGNALSEQLGVSAWNIARDPGNTQAVRALLWLLPKVDPTYAEQSAEEEAEEPEPVIADIPQEVFDAMTPDEVQQLFDWRDELENKRKMLEQKTDALIKGVIRRLSAIDRSKKRAGVH